MVLAVASVCLGSGLAVPLAAQTSGPDRDGAFLDAGARELVERARAARRDEVEGLESYEALLRERLYVGVTGWRFRRERGLVEQERIARVRWTEQGERAVRWVGARRAIPIVGADTWRGDEAGGGAGTGDPREPPADEDRPVEEEVRSDLREELTRELLEEVDLPDFVFQPGGGDRVELGEDWALHPLADTATAHYRYRSGDTLRLTLPDRRVVLHEIRVEPRRADYRLVAASLWFEAETAALVRATYRPGRAFRLGLDRPEDASDVPGFLRPVEGEIRFITAEYSLQELRYWLPRRFALEGEARLGGVVSIPLTLEWSMGEYSVNEESELPITGPLPEGWSRAVREVEEEDGTVHPTTVIVPHPDSLLDSPELAREVDSDARVAFSRGELQELRDELEGLLPHQGLLRPDFAWGWERGLLRFNRVEGLSVGAWGRVFLAPSTTLALTARLGTGDREPNGTLTLAHGPPGRAWEVEAYRRLESMNEEDDPFSLPSSLVNLAFGSDRGAYLRATGASAGIHHTGRQVRARVVVFGETERPVSRTTSFHALKLIGLGEDTVRSVLAADPVDLVGARGRIEWFRGLDPRGLILTAGLRGEVARGEAGYQRVSGRLSAAHPLPLGLSGAMEVAGGVAWGGELPVQREYFLGGGSTLRGFDTNERRGESFWRARAEVGSGFPGARLVLFGDAAWIGARSRFGDEAFRSSRTLVAAGVGASLLDGLFRLDVARALQGAERWKLHLQIDALF